MEECPVCKHGMLMVEALPEGTLLFRCPMCLYLKRRQSRLNSASPKPKKPVIYVPCQYPKKTINQAKVVVSKEKRE